MSQILHVIYLCKKSCSLFVLHSNLTELPVFLFVKLCKKSSRSRFQTEMKRVSKLVLSDTVYKMTYFENTNIILYCNHYLTSLVAVLITQGRGRQNNMLSASCL